MSGANSMSALALPAQRVDASDIKRKVEAGLTSAAIAAIIVKMSRGEYYASGRPCACPDDTARNGSFLRWSQRIFATGWCRAAVLSERRAGSDD